MIKRTLGSYEVLEKLGEGGMGEVYRAHDSKLQRDVAIKLLSAELADSPERLERLQREARMLASIDHPNINAIYAVEEIDGVHFLVLQLVEGTTLAARLGTRRLPEDEALRIGMQIAEALEAAHAKGIVHRDLKPSNVMVSDDGRVKVLDFGIAKATRPAASPDLTSEATLEALTRVGTILGTAPYMSPEQLRGETVDVRTDIWALGCLLFEMCTGKRAFTGDTAADTSAAILTGDPDWSALPDSVPEAVVRLTRRCLRKTASERLPVAADAHSELRDALRALQMPASSVSAAEDSANDQPAMASDPAERPSPPGAAARRRWIGYATVAVLLVVGIGTYRFMGDRSAAPAAESSFRLADQLLATVAPGSHRAPTLSRDGSTMAFVSEASGMARIWVQTLTEGAVAIPITGEEAPALHPSWSAPRNEIVFHRPGDGIWTVGPLGTPAPRRIVEEGINPSFSWDGSRIVYERFPQIWMANADGTDQHAVEGADLLMPTAVQNVVGGFPALSPDGEWIVYFRMASGPMGDFWVVPAAGGEPRRLTFDTNRGSHPIWTPDGRHVIFSSLRSGSQTLWRIAAEGGDPEPVTSGAGEDAEPSLSRDGRRLAYSNVRNEKAMMIYDPEAGESREILVRRYGLIFPRFSPDGESLVFFGEVAGGTDIFVVGADGKGMRQVTRGDGQFNIHPRWSPDGSTIYFYRDNPYREDSPGEFLKVSVAGGPGEVLFLGFYWDRNMFAEVHPLENAVAYLLIEPPPTGSTTVVRDIESGQERVLQTPQDWDTEFPFYLPVFRWSHDGAALAGSDMGHLWRPRDVGGGDQVWVCARDGVCESLVEGHWPVWSADDAQIYFYRPGPNPAMKAIWRADRDGRNARQVTEVGPLNQITPMFDVAPDGRIVWIQNRPGRPEIWAADVE